MAANNAAFAAQQNAYAAQQAAIQAQFNALQAQSLAAGDAAYAAAMASARMAAQIAPPVAQSIAATNSGSASAYIHGALAVASFAPSLLSAAASFVDSLAYFAEGDRINGGIALGAAALGVASDAGLARLGLKGAQVGVDALLNGTLAANKAAGRAAEARAAKDLVAEGNTILGSQVSVRTSEGRRVIDHLI